MYVKRKRERQRRRRQCARATPQRASIKFVDDEGDTHLVRKQYECCRRRAMGQEAKRMRRNIFSSFSSSPEHFWVCVRLRVRWFDARCSFISDAATDGLRFPFSFFILDKWKPKIRTAKIINSRTVELLHRKAIHCAGPGLLSRQPYVHARDARTAFERATESKNERRSTHMHRRSD